MKKYLFSTKLILAIVALLLLSQPALALEVNYPNLPGGFFITGDSSLIQYIAYFFVFILTASGILGIISIVIAGMQILINAGNPSARSAATERIFNSILGIILLLFSIVILRTINLDLVTPKGASAGLSSGIYLVGSGNQIKPAPSSIADTSDSNEFNLEYNSLYYKCDPPGKTLLVSTFDKPNFGVSGNAKTFDLACGSGGVSLGTSSSSTSSSSSAESESSTNIGSSTKSFKIEYQDAGVYYYLSENCTGGLASNIQKNRGPIPLFGNESILNMTNQKVKSVQIVSGTDLDKRYGVILNKNYDGSGECSLPLLNPDPITKCFNLADLALADLDGKPFNPLYGYVVRIYPKLPDGNPNNQQGVNFFSSNFFVKLTAIQIGLQYSIFPEFVEGNGTNGYKGTPNEFMYPACSQSDPNCPPNGGGLGQSFTGDKPKHECTEGDFGPTCINNIIPAGSFYTVVYAKNDIDTNQDGVLDFTDRACRIYNNGVGGLLNNDDFLGGKRKVYRIDLFPRM